MGNLNAGKKHSTSESDLIVSYLSQLALFRNEKASTLNKMAEALVLCSFKKNEHILEQGEEAHCMYIVAEGRVGFTAVNTKTGKSVPLTELEAGATFGEFGLVYDIRRTAGASAITDVVCLRLDREVFEKIKGTKYMKVLNGRVQDVCAMMMRDGLKQLPFLQDFDATTVEEIGHLFKFEVLPKGTVVCDEGQEAERFYIVFNGDLAVTMEDDLGFIQEVSRLGKGSKFGDVALMSGNRRNATVTCLTDCQLFSLGREDFLEFLATVPESTKLKESIQKGRFSNILKESVNIFNYLTPKNLSLIALVSEHKTFAKGTVVLEQGMKSTGYLYVLYEGEMEIIKNDKFVKRMTKGYFGEVSLFSKKNYSSTVKVSSEVAKCLLVPLAAFDLILKQEAAVYAEIALKVLGKEIGLEMVLNHPHARHSFFQHCKKEFAHESITFWSEVCRLEQLEEKACAEDILIALGQSEESFKRKKMSLMKSICKKIYDLHVVPGSSEEINISSKTRKALIERIEKKELSFDMFSDARKEVLQMVEQDNFWRYKESKEFTELLQQVGVYTDT